MSSSDEQFDEHISRKSIRREILGFNSKDNEIKSDSVFQYGGATTDNDFQGYVCGTGNTRSMDNKFYSADAMMFRPPAENAEDDDEILDNDTSAVELADVFNTGDQQQTEPEPAQVTFSTQNNIFDITQNDDIAQTDDITPRSDNDASDGIMGSRPKVKHIEEERKISIVQLSKVYNRRALLKTAKTYELENFEKNAMLIFNMEKCNGYMPRLGTRKDGNDLKTTFGKFGFEVEEKFDMTRNEVFSKLDDFSNQNFTDYGCVAVVFLTHGSDMGSLRAKDKRFYETDIINYFNRREKPTLITKPILIIIQACRGKKMSEAALAGEGDATDKIRKDTDKEMPYHLPIESDMLVLHSTYPNRLAIRHELDGSWFIQTLCNKINQLSETLDLESIMTEVKMEVAIDMELKEFNRAIDRYEIYKQMPTVQTTLIRKLYLRKYGELPDPKQTPEIATKEVEDKVAKSSVMLPFVPCACRLDIFEYLKTCMSHFVDDNPADETAKSYLELAEEFTDSQEFHEAKKKMAVLFRNHLKYQAKNYHYYKFLYFFKDNEVKK